MAWAVESGRLDGRNGPPIIPTPPIMPIPFMLPGDVVPCASAAVVLGSTTRPSAPTITRRSPIPIATAFNVMSHLHHTIDDSSIRLYHGSRQRSGVLPGCYKGKRYLRGCGPSPVGIHLNTGVIDEA